MLTSNCAQYFADVFSKLVAKGRAGANDRQNVDHRLTINRASVAHVPKALRTVVGTHSRGTHTAKWQILLHVMQRNVIDTGTPPLGT